MCETHGTPLERRKTSLIRTQNIARCAIRCHFGDFFASDTNDERAVPFLCGAVINLGPRSDRPPMSGPGLMLVRVGRGAMRRELARTPRGPGPCSRGLHAAGRHCTTRRRNAHRIGNAEGREVLYRWHPWAGCVVDVHAVIEKSSGEVLRCSERGSGERWLELPAWMFDRAACLAVEIAVRPRVDMAVLSALGALLAAAGRPPSSNDPVRGAAGEACDHHVERAKARGLSEISCARPG